MYIYKTEKQYFLYVYVKRLLLRKLDIYLLTRAPVGSAMFLQDIIYDVLTEITSSILVRCLGLCQTYLFIHLFQFFL